MRVDDFEKDAIKNVAEKHQLSEKQLDEVTPFILKNKMPQQKQTMGRPVKPAKPGQPMGTQAARTAGQQYQQNKLQTQQDKLATKMTMQQVKKGKKINLPVDKTGKRTGQFKIDKIDNTRGEVTLIVPPQNRKPGEPDKVTYNATDLKDYL